MLNYLWAAMILIGIVYAMFTGNITSVTQAALDSAGEAISLCITMAGVMAFWMGLMEIATAAGMVEKLTGALRPVLKFLFPRLPRDSKAMEYIATNMVTNMLGLGWACTPAGLKAMEELKKIEVCKGNHYVASNEMCTFLIMNISSLQLIPVNMIAYRSQYGSVNPTGIVGPALFATAVSALMGVIFCKIADKTTYKTLDVSIYKEKNGES